MTAGKCQETQQHKVKLNLLITKHFFHIDAVSSGKKYKSKCCLWWIGWVN